MRQTEGAAERVALGLRQGAEVLEHWAEELLEPAERQLGLQSTPRHESTAKSAAWPRAAASSERSCRYQVPR